MLCFFQCLGFFSIICWQTLFMTLIQYPNVAGIQCPGAASDILWPLLLPHYFFFLLRPYTENLLDVYYTCLLHKWPLFQITLFLFQRRPTFSVGHSPATAWCTVAEQSCCGDVGSYRASQSSLQLTSDPEEIRKSGGEEEPTSTVKSHLESPLHTQLGL